MGRRPNTDFYKRLSVPLSKELYVFVAMVSRASGSTLAATAARIIELYKDAHPEMLEQARQFADFIDANFAQNRHGLADLESDTDADTAADLDTLPEIPAEGATDAAETGAEPPAYMDTTAADAPEMPAETAAETAPDTAPDGGTVADTAADPDGIAD